MSSDQKTRIWREMREADEEGRRTAQKNQYKWIENWLNGKSVAEATGSTVGHNTLSLCTLQLNANFQIKKVRKGN